MTEEEKEEDDEGGGVFVSWNDDGAACPHCRRSSVNPILVGMLTAWWTVLVFVGGSLFALWATYGFPFPATT